MEDSLAFEPNRAAVLSMDLQTGIVSIYAKDDPALPNRAAKVLEGCRNRGMSVIHVQVGFRPGLPEVSLRNPLFGAVKGRHSISNSSWDQRARFTQPWLRKAMTLSSPNTGSTPLPAQTWKWFSGQRKLTPSFCLGLRPAGSSFPPYSMRVMKTIA